MAKFYGVIGYLETKETVPGVWVEEITERAYYGDVIKNTFKWQSSDKVNDDLSISNTISIIADPYAYEHFSSIRYVNWMGTLWKIAGAEVQRPRLNLTLGGVYNGK